MKNAGKVILLKRFNIVTSHYRPHTLASKELELMLRERERSHQIMLIFKVSKYFGIIIILKFTCVL